MLHVYKDLLELAWSSGAGSCKVRSDKQARRVRGRYIDSVKVLSHTAG